MRMRKMTLLVFLPLLFFNCQNQRQNSAGKKLKYINKCDFAQPDTSVSGIKIRDVESTLKVLGKHEELVGDSTFVFYSEDKLQNLSLTFHPGDSKGEVSIFKVAYSNNPDLHFHILDITEFITESGLKLGITKVKVVEKLGNCYVEKNKKGKISELLYRIESPNDSKTKLLSNNNMPVYYSTYKFVNDTLRNFEFGFEYP